MLSVVLKIFLNIGNFFKMVKLIVHKKKFV